MVIEFLEGITLCSPCCGDKMLIALFHLAHKVVVGNTRVCKMIIS